MAAQVADPRDSQLGAEFNDAFDQAILDQRRQSGMEVEDWFSTGNMKPWTDVERWRWLGPQVCQNFIDWYEANEYEVALDPADEPMIEYQIDAMFGTVPVRAYVDAVLWQPKHKYLLVLDTKSGASVPDNAQQLGFYASCLEWSLGVRPHYGAFFMARGAGRNKDVFLTDLVDLSVPQYSYNHFTWQLQRMQAGVSAGAYVANVGKQCRTCGVAQSCAAVGGEYARITDPDHGSYAP